MIVVDASAPLESVSAATVNEPLAERLLAEAENLHAPHLIDVEVLSGLRRLQARREIAPDRAVAARSELTALAIERYPHAGLTDRMWELGDNLSAYDASYLVLSELLRAPLITCDGRLARSPGHRAVVEYFPRA